MGITYLPGPEAQLLPGLQSLMQGLDQYINPNRQFQRAAQAQILNNPQVVQQLADIEKISPGFLRGLGLGGLSEQISAVPQSMAAMIEQGVRPAVTEVLRDKSMVDIAATKTVIGQRPAEINIEALKSKLATLGVKALDDPEVAAYVGRLSVGYEPGAVAKGRFEEATMTDALKILSEGPDITVSKFLNKEYSPAQLAAIYSTPLGEALNAQLQVYMNDLRVKASKETRGETLDKYYLGRAYDLSKLTGSFDIQAALKIVKGEVSPTTATGDAKKIYEKLAQMDAQDRANFIRKFDEDITLAMTRFANVKQPKGVSKEQVRSTKEGIVRQINSYLEGRAAAGTPKYSVEFKHEDPWYQGPSSQMVFKDEFGNTVAPEAALAAIPPAPGAQSDSTANKAYQLIMGLKPELRAEALRKLEARGDMEVYAKVLQKMGTTAAPVTVTP